MRCRTSTLYPRIYWRQMVVAVWMSWGLFLGNYEGHPKPRSSILGSAGMFTTIRPSRSLKRITQSRNGDAARPDDKVAPFLSPGSW